MPQQACVRSGFGSVAPACFSKMSGAMPPSPERRGGSCPDLSPFIFYSNTHDQSRNFSALSYTLTSFYSSAALIIYILINRPGVRCGRDPAERADWDQNRQKNRIGGARIPPAKAQRSGQGERSVMPDPVADTPGRSPEEAGAGGSRGRRKPMRRLTAPAVFQDQSCDSQRRRGLFPASHTEIGQGGIGVIMTAGDRAGGRGMGGREGDR